MAGRPNPYEAEAAAIDERLNPPRPAPTAATNPYEAEAQQVDSKITGMRPPANPGYLAASPDDSATETAAKFAATGALRGVSHLPGMVGDVRDLGNYLFDWTQHKVGGRPLDEVRAENAANRAKATKEIYGDGWLRYISPANVLPSGSEVAAGLGKYTGLYDPTTPMGRVGMGALEAAFSGPVGAIKRGTSVPGALMESAAMAPAVAVGGGASTAAAEMGVENPFILMGAGLAGTAAAQKAAAVAGRGYNATIDALGPAWERRPDMELPDGSVMPGSAGTPILNKLPGVEGSGWRQAAREFQDITGRGAADPAAARDAALRALGTESYELVPGSRATTAQVTGDMGQQVLERALATSNKEPWLLRMGEQQAAQSRAVRGTAPEADIQALPRRLAESKQQMIQALDDHIASLTTDAADRASALGGLGGPAAAGSRIEQAMRPIWDRTLAQAQQAADSLGARSAEAVGQEARAVMDQRYAAAKQYVSRLYRAVEDANPTLDVRRLQNGLAQAYGDLTPEARMGLHPAEMPLLSMIGSYEPGMPFRRLRDLEVQVNQALADTRAGAPGASPAANRRISMLRSALEDTYSDAAAGTMAAERNAVARGEVHPDDTLTAAIAKLKAEADAFLERSGAGYRIDVGPDGTARRGTVPSGNGVQVSPAGGPADATSAEALSGTQGLDPATLEALRNARAARRDQGVRFERNPVEAAIVTDRNGLPKMPPEKVPAQFFRSDRDGGGTTMDQFLAAAGPRGADLMRAHAAERLRAAALAPDGTIDRARALRFIEQHQGALQRIPGAEAQFRAAAEAGASMRSLEPYVPGTPPEVLPTHFFRAGPAGADGVRELRRMIGPPAADDIMADYGASLIQSKAVVNGMVDEGRLRSLTQSYAGAFGEVPALRAAANDAAEAAKIVAEAARARKDALANMERSAFGKIAGMSTDAEVRSKIGTLLGSASGERELGRLIADLKASPDSEMALAGLRRAAAEHVADRLTANGEAFGQGLDSARMKSDQAQSYIRANESRLRLALGDDGFDVLEKIALDLKRQQRSLTGGSLPARSNTTPDALETMRYAVPDMRQSWVSSVWSQFTPSRGALAMFIGAPYAVALGTADWVTALGGRLRAAGIQNRQDFLTAMVMHPEIAAKGLMEMPREPKASAPFIRALGNLSVMNPRRNED